jgi:hypothetical protein
MEEAGGGGVIPVWACWTGLDPRCSTEVVRFELVTRASPEQVLRALTDFSDRRVHTWSRTLDPKTYEVREQGDTWAVARESTPGSPYWVVARYDWSDPAVVRWTTAESSYGGGGTGSVRIAPGEGGGSRLEVEWSYTGITRPRDRIMLPLIQTWPMARLIRGMWTTALDRYAEAGDELGGA